MYKILRRFISFLYPRMLLIQPNYILGIEVKDVKAVTIGRMKTQGYENSRYIVDTNMF